MLGNYEGVTYADTNDTMIILQEQIKTMSKDYLPNSSEYLLEPPFELHVND